MRRVSVRSTGSRRLLAGSDPFDEHTDDNGHTTFILREWKRRDWEKAVPSLRGGAPTTPCVQRGPPRVEDLTGEIVELVGEGPYQRLVDVIRERVEHAERGNAPCSSPSAVRRHAPS